MKEWSLQKRVLFLALAPLTVAELLLSLHFTNARIQDLEDALRNRGQTIATQLAAISEDAFLSGNRQVLARFVQSTLQEKNVMAGTVTDMEGNILAHASETADKSKPPPLAESSRYKLLAPVYYSEEAGYARPGGGAATASKKQTGWVTVQLSRAALQTEQNKILFQSLFIVLLGLVVTIVFALRMARGVTRPVISLTHAVEKIKNGVLDYRVSTQSGGEGGRAQVTLESIGDGVITTDAAGRIVYMNPVAEQFTEWKGDLAQGKPLSEVFKIFDEESNRLEEYPIHYCLREGRTIRHDSHHLLMSHEGGKIEIQDSAAPIRDRDGAILGAVGGFHDV